MDLKSVQSSYARWAPVYDKTFGVITNTGRQYAVDYINTCGGSVLEVGVGTGLALGLYAPHMQVTGIDFSVDMLAKARGKVIKQKLSHVPDLLQMDARDIKFPDNHFNTVAAMHVISVVPEPEQVMAEMARVCKPGGQIVITNHFSRDGGFLGLVERLSAPFANTLGWHADFDIQQVLQEKSLSIHVQEPLPPIGMMTFLVLRKSQAM